MKIPDVELYDLERNPINLTTFIGKKTIIAFFPGAFTGGCTEELCSFQSDLNQFSDFLFIFYFLENNNYVKLMLV